MFNLLRKTLRDKRLFTIGWAVGLAVLGFFMVSLYPSFNDVGLDQLTESLPESMRGLVGDMSIFKELPSYIGGQLFDIRIPILASVLAILLSVGLTVGEEDKGYIRTLVALPLSRVKIALTKWLAIVTISTIAVLGTIAGVEVGLLVINEALDQMVLVRLGGMMLLLVLAMASAIFAIGLASGKRGLTMAIGILVTVGGFILTTFARGVDWLKTYEFLSIFYYYPAVDIAKGIVEPLNLLVMGAIIVISLAVAIIFFRRRDIKSA